MPRRHQSNLPVEVHDHFRKANLLHGYVQKSLGEATKHALETGQELLSAKKVVPHGRWEDECDRLFDGSSRTARFYMEFARNLTALKTAERSAVLMLEGSLDGAAKAAKRIAQLASGSKPPKPPKQEPKQDVIDAEFEAVEPPREDAGSPQPDYGKCPNCAGTKWDEDDEGVACAKCHHPHGEPAGEVDDDRLKIQRQKTVKTVEALMRAFDDLQVMQARPEHADVIRTCKALLKTAKEWK